MKINVAGSNLRNLKRSKHLTDQRALSKDQQLVVRGPTAEPRPEEEGKTLNTFQEPAAKVNFKAGACITEEQSP